MIMVIEILDFDAHNLRLTLLFWRLKPKFGGQASCFVKLVVLRFAVKWKSQDHSENLTQNHLIIILCSITNC